MLAGLGVAAAVIVAGVVVGARRRRPASSRPAAVDDDAELREVFIAEARGLLPALERDLAHWRLAPANLERVVPLRRGFHTLKGSGLLVGATTLGGLSATIEKLLLRVIERELSPQPDAIEVVARAVAALPGLIADYAGNRRNASAAPIAAAAERLLRRPGPRLPATAQSSRR